MGVAEMLRILRKQNGITQKELAEATGIPYRSIVNYENGLREPNSRAMSSLESYFGVSGAYLRGEGEIDSGDDLPVSLKTFAEEYKTASEEEQSDLDGILSASTKLNPNGKEELCKRAEELTHLPQYKK